LQGENWATRDGRGESGRVQEKVVAGRKGGGVGWGLAAAERREEEGGKDIMRIEK
jgi:hypothetical protein